MQKILIFGYLPFHFILKPLLDVKGLYEMVDFSLLAEHPAVAATAAR